LAGSDLFERLDQALSEALECSPVEREMLLQKLARDDPEVAVELRLLLQQAERSELFLTLPAAAARDQLLAQALHLDEFFTHSGGDRSGHSLGRFRLERKLASSLRSEVYLAHREDPEWQQQVVVKILIRGIAADDVLRRFLAERQILSVLHHPQIATLLDGGMTDDGLPYFVMEYIEGLPVSDYCKNGELGLELRLDLCLQICQAVAFAHRHLVVHRDLKPSNILVTPEGRVKLLDFGIAKLLDPIVDPAIAPRTDELVRPMTPQYAAPEQQAGGPITTATDVYQLGLVFLEILAGVELSGGTAETRQVIESQPASLLAQRVGAGLPYSGRLLRGDLDWILLKALALRPGDRYGSASELQDDLERYLAHQPVRARRPSLPYLARKFIRRRPVLSASLGLVTLATTAFVILMVIFMQRIEAERTAALAAAERAEEVSQLLVSFIAAPDPYSGSGADARVSEVLQASEEEIFSTLSDRPQLQVELLSLLADVYQNLALHQRSVAVRQREIDLRSALQDSNNPEVLQSRRKMAESQQVLGEVDPALQEFLALREELALNQPADQPERARVDIAISAIHSYYGQAAVALPYIEEAVNRLEPLPEEAVLLAEALHQQALVLGALTRHDEAFALLQRAYRLRLEHQGAEHVSTLMERTQLAANFTNRGQYLDSIAIYQEVIPDLERRLGPLHPQVLTVLNNAAVSHDLAGKLQQSAELHRDVLQRRREKFGDQHGDVADSLQNLGSVLTRLGHLDEALVPLKEAARLFPGIYQPGSPRLAYPHISLAIVYAQTGPDELLEVHARTALSLLEGNVPDNHPALLRGQCLLGDALLRQGDRAEGMRLLQESISGLQSQTSISPLHLEACQQVLAAATASNES
jgi:serine/threonine protein kinase/tetratricopeptide (TPR) repeat protein